MISEADRDVWNEMQRDAAPDIHGQESRALDVRGGDRGGTAFMRYEPLWPWGLRWWKPKDRRRDLVRAGALILAEIERLDRALPHPELSSEKE